MRLATVALVLALLTAPWVLWSYLPAPTLELWYLAALVGEYRLLLALAALAALLLSLSALRSGGVLPALAAVIALVSFVGVLVPEVQTYRAARAAGAALSPAAYLRGLTAPVARPPRAETYAVVGGQALKLDLWEPALPSAAPRPAVVRVHGGGWTSGERGEAAHWNAWLTEQGFVVFDVDYRLAPPPRWQDAPGDVKCALGWVKRHAADLGVDPRQIVLLGSSSGGHLALLAAYSSGDARLPPSCFAEDVAVAAVVALSAPTDLAWEFERTFPWGYPDALASTEGLEAFTGGTPSTVPEAYRLGSPVGHVKGGLPPTLLVHGERDRLVSVAASGRLAAELETFDVPHRVLKLPFADHLFDFSRGGWGTQVTQAVVKDFLAAYVPSIQRAAEAAGG